MLATIMYGMSFLSFGFYLWTGVFQEAVWGMFFYLAATLEGKDND